MTNEMKTRCWWRCARSWRSEDESEATAVAMGDDSQLHWEDAPDWQKDSARAGVRAKLANPETTPEQMHHSWLAQKKADGWVYGKKKDPEAKTHPCMVPYDQLPICTAGEGPALRYKHRAGQATLRQAPPLHQACDDGVSLTQWNELVAFVNHTSTFGTDNVRDPDYPCTGFVSGEPTPRGRCSTDGHYMCDECVERATCDGGCGKRPTYCECLFCSHCFERHDNCLCPHPKPRSATQR